MIAKRPTRPTLWILFMKIFGNVRYYQLPWSLKTKESRDWPELQNFCTLKNFKIKFKKEFNFLTKSYYNHNKIKSNSKKIISKFKKIKRNYGSL